MAKRYELSDESWAVVADLFTESHGRGRPRLSDRLMLDGVLWVLCSGAAWRDMPERFGPWSTVYQRFRGWRNQGTFDQMLKRLHLRLNEQGLIDLQIWMIDSTAIRATRASSGCAFSSLEVKPVTSATPNPCWTRSAFHQANVAARVNAINGCLPTRATTPRRYAATATNIECNPSSRCAR